MAEILDEFSQEIRHIEHFHCENEMITLVSCVENSLYVYSDDHRMGCCRISSNCMNIAKYYLRHKPVEDVEKLLVPFQLSALLMVDLVGDFLVAITQDKEFVFFNKSLKQDLLQNSVKNEIMNYVSSKFSVYPFLKAGCSVLIIKLISLEKEYNTILLSKELYLALFGVENYKRSLQILLLVLSNGQIWYSPLHAMCIPQFLYSLNDECLAVKTLLAGSEMKLQFCTETGKIISFSPKCAEFEVEEKWLKKDRDQLHNFCNKTDDFQNCLKCLVARRNLILSRRDIVKDGIDNGTKLSHLRLDIADLEVRRKVLLNFHKTRSESLKINKSLAIISVENEKRFEFSFTQFDMEVKLVKFDSFSTFHVVLASDLTTETFWSRSAVLKIPLENVIHCHQADCYFNCNSVVIKGNCCKFNLLNLMTYCEDDKWSDKRFSFDLTFSKKYVSRNGSLSSSLLSPEISSKKSIFSLKILNCTIFVKCVESDCGDSYMLHATSSNETVLAQFKAVLLSKVDIISRKQSYVKDVELHVPVSLNIIA